jgi:Mg2+ and Co2+ transporter CorA
VDCDAALDLMAQGNDGGDGFVWLHFSSSNVAAERWLRNHLELPDSFHEALHEEGVGATRAEQDGDALVAVLHDVLFELRYDTADVSTVCLCVQPRLMISARPRPLRSIDRVRAAVKGGEALGSPVQLLAQLLHNQAEVMVGIVRQTTARVDGIEDQLLRHRISVSRAELSALRCGAPPRVLHRDRRGECALTVLGGSDGDAVAGLVAPLSVLQHGRMIPFLLSRLKVRSTPIAAMSVTSCLPSRASLRYCLRR